MKNYDIRASEVPLYIDLSEMAILLIECLEDRGGDRFEIVSPTNAKRNSRKVITPDEIIKEGRIPFITKSKYGLKIYRQTPINNSEYKDTWVLSNVTKWQSTLRSGKFDAIGVIQAEDRSEDLFLAPIKDIYLAGYYLQAKRFVKACCESLK